MLDMLPQRPGLDGSTRHLHGRDTLRRASDRVQGPTARSQSPTLVVMDYITRAPAVEGISASPSKSWG